jgi:hypothetical protein
MRERQQADKIVQVEALGKHILEEGRMRPGVVFWATEKRARELVDLRVVRVIGGPAPAPEGFNGPNSFSVAPATLTTDSVSSEPVSGAEAQQSQSAADQASPMNTSTTFVRRKRVTPSN